MKVHNFCEKQKAFFRTYKLEIGYFLMVVFSMVRTIPSYELIGDFWRSYNLSYYALSYQTAGCFVARGLVGSIVQLFFSHINSRVLYIIFWVIYLLFYTVLGFNIIKIIKQKKGQFLHFLFLCICIFNPAVLNYASDFTRPDIFMVLLAILCMRIIYNGKCTLLVPVICLAGMLIHEGFIVIFVPIIATYLLQQCIERKKIKETVTLILLVVCTVGLLVFIMKYGKSSVEDIDALHLAAQNTIDVPLNPNMIDFEQGTMRADLGNISFEELKEYKTIIALAFYVVIFLPIVITYGRIMCNASDKIKQKILFLFSLLAPFSGLLMIVAGVDYGRWFSMTITCCMIRMYYCLKGNSFEIDWLLRIKNIEIWAYVGIAVLVCYVTMGTMGDIHEHFDYINKLNSLFNFVRDSI